MELLFFYEIYTHEHSFVRDYRIGRPMKRVEYFYERQNARKKSFTDTSEKSRPGEKEKHFTNRWELTQLVPIMCFCRILLHYIIIT